MNNNDIDLETKAPVRVQRIVRRMAKPTGRRYNSVESLMRGEGISKTVIRKYLAMRRKEVRCKHVWAALNDYPAECAKCGKLQNPPNEKLSD